VRIANWAIDDSTLNETEQVAAQSQGAQIKEDVIWIRVRDARVSISRRGLIRLRTSEMCDSVNKHKYFG
jgi:hypothetical protein